MRLRELLLLPVVLCVPSEAFCEGLVEESPRSLPIVDRVDVFVAGGTTGAVSAAVAAARGGARVFLAAPHPYLGEDMTATLRLWLEEGETPRSPLGKRIFAEGPRRPLPFDPDRVLPFEYETDVPSAAVHRDRDPPSRLRDGKWDRAVSESVQYNADVTIRLQLEAEAAVEGVHVLVYHDRDFLVGEVHARSSVDADTWTEWKTTKNTALPQGAVDVPAIAISVPLNSRAQFLQVRVERKAGAARLLLAEVAVSGPEEEGGRAPDDPERTPPARPLYVKKTLDEALLEAGVRYVYSSYVTGIIHDHAGLPAGVVLANRAGRQAVAAKVIIDGTRLASVARLAGGTPRAAPADRRCVSRVVVGGSAREDEGLTVRRFPGAFIDRRTYDLFEYTFELSLGDGGYLSRAEAEQRARDLTYSPEQQFAADEIFDPSPSAIVGLERATGPWTGAGALNLRAFRPKGVPRLLLAGPCGDLPPPHQEKLARPLEWIDLGARIGEEAAREASSLGKPEGLHVSGDEGDPTVGGDVREFLVGLRPTDDVDRLAQERRTIPVVARYDVVVVGGGTSGAPAGIGAARQGVKTLVVEYLYGLGGVGTQGAISNYYWGNRVGFSAEVTSGTGGTSWKIEQKMEWWRNELRAAGADIWFGAMGCGAFVRDGDVRGVVVATPDRRGVVLADVVIDATGNADVAAAAGARYRTTDEVDIAVQGTGLPPRRLGTNYTNTDFTIVDETDMIDVWHVLVYAKYKAGSAFDMGKLLDTRERRSVAGDFTISILDQMIHRTYGDTVVVCYSDFDTHGYTTHPYFTLEHPEKKQGFHVHIPYRALLPRGLEGLLVVGLGMSAHRDAVPLIRMQADLQNQGYAAGLAAAKAHRDRTTLRGIDIRSLQKELVEVGNLPPSVLDDEDSYPLPEERIEAAVEAAGDGYRDVAVLLSHPDIALPLLKRSYARADTPERRLRFGHILAVLRDASGVDDLITAVRAFSEFDEGWRYQAMGQFGPNMSRLDRLIYALGCTRDRRATAPILEKVRLLTADHEFSHFRAIALALDNLRAPEAAKPLAELLSRPGIRGHAMETIEEAIERAKRWPSWTATEPRSLAIRELLLARALYRSGDHEDLGRRVLEEYAKDLRGHLSRHATAVLKDVE